MKCEGIRWGSDELKCRRSKCNHIWDAQEEAPECMAATSEAEMYFVEPIDHPVLSDTHPTMQMMSAEDHNHLHENYRPTERRTTMRDYPLPRDVEQVKQILKHWLSKRPEDPELLVCLNDLDAAANGALAVYRRRYLEEFKHKDNR